MTHPAPLRHDVLDRPGPAERLLVLLHGYGRPATELTDRLDLIDPDGRFLGVVAEAPYRWKDKRIWHRPMSAGTEATDQLLTSTEALDQLLGELGPSTGLEPGQAVVGGFSQGGGVALTLLLGAGTSHRPAAAFGVCSFPPPVDGFRVDLVAVRGRPCFLASVRDDVFADIELSRQGARALRDIGLDLTYVETDGAHEMTDEAAGAIGRWLTTVHRGHRTMTPPVEPDPGFTGPFGVSWVLEG